MRVTARSGNVAAGVGAMPVQCLTNGPKEHDPLRDQAEGQPRELLHSPRRAAQGQRLHLWLLSRVPHGTEHGTDLSVKARTREILKNNN